MRTRLQPNQRKKQIENVAYQLFCEKGYSNVTMGEIAATCNIARPTIYEYFVDKKAILISIVSAKIKSATTSYDKDLPLLEQLKETIKNQFRVINEDTYIYSLYLQEVTFSSENSVVLYQNRYRFLQQYKRILKELKKQQILADDIDIADSAYTIHAIVSQKAGDALIARTNLNISKETNKVFSYFTQIIKITTPS